MNNITKRVAFTLLLSLGLTACGSKKNETSINTQPSVEAAELAALNLKLTNAEKEAAQKETLQTRLSAAVQELTGLQAALEREKSANTTNSSKVTDLEQQITRLQTEITELGKKLELAQTEDLEKAIENAKQAVKDEIAFIKQSGTSNSQNPTTEAYKILTENDKASLATLIQSTPSIDNAKSNTYAASVKQGTLMAAVNKSYLGYAIVREAYAANDRSTPANSYIYSVNTPTTDINKVTNITATYKGMATYTAKNATTVIKLDRENAFTLTLNDSKVSGEIRNAPGPKTPNGQLVIALNSADVAVQNGVVGFNGTATFVEQFVGTGAAEGTYKGTFGGQNAEEVVGTFESNTSTKDAGIQGAFIGTKQGE